MKKEIILFFTLSFSLAFAAAFGYPPSDDAETCWQKGVQAALLAKDYVPGRIYMKFEQLDSDGKTKEQNETWLEVLPGEKEAKLLKALKDGKDVTKETLEKERLRREKLKEKGDKGEGGRSLNLGVEEIVPLISNVKNPVAHTYLGRENEGGVECQVFEFKKEYLQKRGTKSERVTYQGKIWLDAGSGMPVKSSCVLAPLPSMVKQMEMHTAYVREGDKFYVSWHKLYVKAGFLFLIKRMRINFFLGAFRPAAGKEQGE